MSTARLPEKPVSQQPFAMQGFMAGLIDYAGLFPPSQLPIAEAIQSFAKYRQEQDAWMLSRFIIPDTILTELEPFSHLFKDNPPFRFSVTFRGGETYDWFLENLKTTLARIKKFEQKYGKDVKIEMLEAKLPVFEGGSHNPETLLVFFQSIEHTIQTSLDHSLQLFIEVPWTVEFHDDFKSTHDDLFDHAATAIQWVNKQTDSDRTKFGFKLRCGGERPLHVPSSDIVASALSHVIRTKIPFKATAGLHHPMRHYANDFGGMMHGFINVFAAGVIGKKHKLSQKQLIDIIGDEIASNFKLTETNFSWRDLSIRVGDLEQSRHIQFISYGSCSFDEPREDLVELGLLK
jgi:hypothetical protein